MLKDALKERKSSIDNDESDLTIKCRVIQKRYSNFQERFNENHDKLKNLKEELKNSTTIRVISLFANPHPSSNKIFEIAHLRKKVIVLLHEKIVFL